MDAVVFTNAEAARVAFADAFSGACSNVLAVLSSVARTPGAVAGKSLLPICGSAALLTRLCSLSVVVLSMTLPLAAAAVVVVVVTTA